MLRVDRTVGQQRITKPAYRRAHHIQLVVNLPVCAEFFILHNHRDIINAPLFRQAQQTTFVIFNQHQPGQPHRHLITRLAMLMRMEPAGRRALVRRKGYAALITGFNNALRPAIHLTRHFQTMPVQRGLFCQRIVDINRHRFPLA